MSTPGKDRLSTLALTVTAPIRTPGASPETRRVRKLALAALTLVAATSARAADIGTAFTYQGSLENGSGPVDDNCDFRFGLWDAAAGGNQVGTSPQTVVGVTVENGVFTAPIDFGVGAIDGSARWLEIEVKCPPDVGFTSLLPRVELTPAPTAIRASEGVGPPAAPWGSY